MGDLVNKLSKVRKTDRQFVLKTFLGWIEDQRVRDEKFLTGMGSESLYIRGMNRGLLNLISLLKKEIND